MASVAIYGPFLLSIDLLIELSPNFAADSLNKAEFDLLNSDSKTPIFTPRTLKNLNEYTKGSENSLLNLTEDELLLTKGFDEDGSFRGRYAE